MSVTTCPKCGLEASSSDAFCASCGTILPASAAFGVTPAPSSLTPSGSAARKDRLLERLRVATVGRFEVIRILGRGGMAAVYLAYDLRLERRVALKVMLPQFDFSEGMAERFAREARTAARLTHPNIMVVHDVLELDDLVLLVMNLIHGASLEAVVQQLPATPGLQPRQLPVPAVQSVLVQVATALEYAHAERVIHRDIKPSNVMITTRGDAVITDFGIAKVAADIQSTSSSVLIGTPTYMSPEQWRGHAVSGACDQYSLGVMAYELLAGEPPFLGGMIEVQQAHLDQEPVPLLERRADVPPELSAAVQRMLAKRPSERYASLGAVADAISERFDRFDQGPRRLLGSASTLADASRDDGGATAGGTPPSGGAVQQVVPSVSDLVISAPISAVVGDAFEVAVRAVNVGGREVAGVAVSLASDTPHCLVVTGTSARAIAPGEARLRASGGGRTVMATLEIVPRATDRTTVPVPEEVARVEAVRLTPPPAPLTVGGQWRCVAEALARDGKPLPGLAMAWDVDNSSVAAVSDGGLVTARAPGRATITCVCDGVTASVLITVEAKPVLPPRSGDVRQPDSWAVEFAPEEAPRVPEARVEEALRGSAAEPALTAPTNAGGSSRRGPLSEARRKLALRGAVAALVAMLALTVWYFSRPSEMGGPPIAASEPASVAPAKIDPHLAGAAYQSVLAANYRLATDNRDSVFEDWSRFRESAVIRGGVYFPPPSQVRDSVIVYQPRTVSAGELIARIDFVLDSTSAGAGSGLVLSALPAKGGAARKAWYQVMVRRSDRTVRVIQRSSTSARVREVIAATSAPGLIDGRNAIDVVIMAGRIRIYVNDALLTPAAKLPLAVSGDIGLFVSDRDSFGFAKFVAVAIAPFVAP